MDLQGFFALQFTRNKKQLLTCTQFYFKDTAITMTEMEPLF